MELRISSGHQKEFAVGSGQKVSGTQSAVMVRGEAPKRVGALVRFTASSWGVENGWLDHAWTGG